MKTIYFAGGCFWGTQHYFKQIKGVISTQTGYANGSTLNPTYEQVYTDTTGYAETVCVSYDEHAVSTEFLIEMFFHAIDPTSLNRQGGDCGVRYRTGIYSLNEDDLSLAKSIIQEKQKQFEDKIVVEVLPLKNFYPAEEYHQNYLDKNSDGYCHIPSELFDFARRAGMVKP
ncbi:MAG: peptide-methionine (S)-S-oxide reductase MsrA [Bacteroidales bacterium]|nr:peptide-methionine (S)-S-oxide reductase MsrA [Bacteroidales bacterium]